MGHCKDVFSVININPLRLVGMPNDAPSADISIRVSPSSVNEYGVRSKVDNNSHTLPVSFIVHQLHLTDTSFSVFGFPIAAALARKFHEKKHQSNEEQRGHDIEQARRHNFSMGWCGILFHVVLVSVGVLALFVRVSLLALLFVGAGLGLAYLTWWFWTTARPESPALAALELMSEREYMQLPDEEKDAFLAPWRQLQHVQARKHLTKVQSRPKPPRRLDVNEPQVDIDPSEDIPRQQDSQKHAAIDPLLRG